MNIGFIGAGKMATALAKGLIAAEFVSSDDIVASDSFEAARHAFFESTAARTTASNEVVIDEADVVFLAVKPQVMGAVLDEISRLASEAQIFVSIAAGVSLETLEKSLKRQRVIRVMPNTPCLVGAGAAGIAQGSKATDDDMQLVQRMFETVGIAVPVPEKLLDAVTGLSGSGPAYGFEIIEALSDGGVLMGLPRPTATQLAAQTLLGAAKMVLETGQHPGELKDAVTSPGGTTITGLHEMERAGLRGILMNAVQAAALKSAELGKK